MTITLFILPFILSSTAISSENHPSFGSFYKVIVIDPGHGGRDNGSLGADNTKEKAITLTLARIINDMLKDSYKVVLTRSDDNWVDLNDRSAMANNQKADIFISLHAGGSFNHTRKGPIIYYSRDFSKTDPASETAKPELLSEDIDPVCWDSIQEKHIEKSKMAADIFSSCLKNQIHDIECGIQYAPLSVLSGADMPAVLIEIGCLSNPSEEKKMCDNGYLIEFAKGIIKGVDDFFEKKREDVFQTLR